MATDRHSRRRQLQHVGMRDHRSRGWTVEKRAARAQSESVERWSALQMNGTRRATANPNQRPSDGPKTLARPQAYPRIIFEEVHMSAHYPRPWGGSCGLAARQCGILCIFSAPVVSIRIRIGRTRVSSLEEHDTGAQVQHGFRDFPVQWTGAGRDGHRHFGRAVAGRSDGAVAACGKRVAECRCPPMPCF